MVAWAMHLFAKGWTNPKGRGGHARRALASGRRCGLRRCTDSRLTASGRSEDGIGALSATFEFVYCFAWRSFLENGLDERIPAIL